jgi:hypothetical protein
MVCASQRATVSGASDERRVCVALCVVQEQVLRSRPFAVCVLSGFAVVALAIFASSWAALEPTMYGLAYNSVSGSVDAANPFEGTPHVTCMPCPCSLL